MKTALSVQVVRRSRRRGATLKVLREKVEKDVRNASINANITIIEGHGTSQYGNGIVSARIAEMILRAERTTIPIGSHQPEFGVTLFLRSVVGRGGATAILPLQLSDEGAAGVPKSASNLNAALEWVKVKD
jgi:L-lactate dehydrogenase